jgi:hypothetical protein
MTFVDWYVSTSSFSQYTARARHWYVEVGRDVDGHEATQMTHVLDPAEAHLFSAIDDWGWKSGDDTERFDSRERAIAAAITFFEETAQTGDRLLLGYDFGQDRQILAVKR